MLLSAARTAASGWRVTSSLKAKRSSVARVVADMAGVRTRPMANKPFFSDTARMAEQLGAKPLLPTDHDGAHLPSDGVLADGTPKLVPLDQARMKHRGFDENGEPILDWVGGGEAQDRTAAARAAGSMSPIGCW